MKNSLFDLSGKVALVTGSSRGIGKAIALRMAQHGADVVISGRRSEACDAAVAEIEAARDDSWGHASALQVNISRPAEISALVEGALARHGKIDILVANAAINLHVGPTLELTEAVMRKVIETNVMSLYWLTQAVLPGMKERGDGRIIGITSIAAELGNSGSLSYAMTKAAGDHAMQTLAVEFGPYGIRCNAIAPGAIFTDMSRGVLTSSDYAANYLARTPLRAIGEPDQIAGAAVFLASAAGSYVNGQTLVVDGGYTVA